MSENGYKVRVVWVLALLGVIVFAWAAHKILFLAFAGLLIALILTTLIHWAQRFLHVGHKTAVAMVLALVFALLALGGWMLAKPIISQFSQLGEALPEQLKELEQQVKNTSWFPMIQKYLPSGQETGQKAGQAMSSVSQAFSSIMHGATSVLLVLFVAIFMAVDPKLYHRGVVKLVPIRHRPKAETLIDKEVCTLKHWLFGQMISMVIVGVLITSGLAIIGVPFAPALGLFAGLAEFVPVFGSIFSAVPALLMAFSKGPSTVLMVLGLFALVQMIEGNVLMPLIQKRTVDLPPVITLLTIVFFSNQFGFLGLFLATPLTAVGLVMIQELYVKEYLGDRE